jgi:hypothetical protein
VALAAIGYLGRRRVKKWFEQKIGKKQSEDSGEVKERDDGQNLG